MQDGRAKAGERLPSTRALSSSLGVSRTVVTVAYEQPPGLHLAVELPESTTNRVGERAAEADVLLARLDDRYAGPPRMHDLVIGYGAVTVAQITSGCARVRALVAEEGCPAGGRTEHPGRSRARARGPRAAAGAGRRA